MSQAKIIKEIRDNTGAGVMDIKKALDEAGGDKAKALNILKIMARTKASIKSSRNAKSGLIDSYNHAGRIGVLIEVNCETDFVARNPEFKNFVHEVALQIASMAPADIASLLNQPFIKDESISINQLLESLVGKVGENIVIKRFSRYSLGED